MDNRETKEIEGQLDQLEVKEHRDSVDSRDCRVNREQLEIQVLQAARDLLVALEQVACPALAVRQVQLETKVRLEFRDSVDQVDLLDTRVLSEPLDRQGLWEIPDLRDKLDLRDPRVQMDCQELKVLLASLDLKVFKVKEDQQVTPVRQVALEQLENLVSRVV